MRERGRGGREWEGQVSGGLKQRGGEQDVRFKRGRETLATGQSMGPREMCVYTYDT